MRGSEMMNKYDKGYISLYRKFKNWRYYTNDNIKSVFIHCLLSACWEDTVISEYNGKPIKPIVLKRGSFITSRSKLAVELNKTDGEIQQALRKLSGYKRQKKCTNKSTNSCTKQKESEISIVCTKQYTIISVDKFEEFQPLIQSIAPTNSSGLKGTVAPAVAPTNLPHINKDINKDIKDIKDIKDKSVSTPLKEHNSLTIKLIKHGFIDETDVPETFDILFEKYLEDVDYSHLNVILDYILKRAHPSRIKNKYSYLKKSINSNLKKMDEIRKKKNLKPAERDHSLEELFDELFGELKEGKL